MNYFLGRKRNLANVDCHSTIISTIHRSRFLDIHIHRGSEYQKHLSKLLCRIKQSCPILEINLIASFSFISVWELLTLTHLQSRPSFSELRQETKRVTDLQHKSGGYKVRSLKQEQNNRAPNN